MSSRIKKRRRKSINKPTPESRRLCRESACEKNGICPRCGADTPTGFLEPEPNPGRLYRLGNLAAPQPQRWRFLWGGEGPAKPVHYKKRKRIYLTPELQCDKVRLTRKTDPVPSTYIVGVRLVHNTRIITYQARPTINGIGEVNCGLFSAEDWGSPEQAAEAAERAVLAVTAALRELSGGVAGHEFEWCDVWSVICKLKTERFWSGVKIYNGTGTIIPPNVLPRWVREVKEEDGSIKYMGIRKIPHKPSLIAPGLYESPEAANVAVQHLVDKSRESAPATLPFRAAASA